MLIIVWPAWLSFLSGRGSWNRRRVLRGTPASGCRPPLLSSVLCQPWHPVCGQCKTKLDAHKWATQTPATLDRSWFKDNVDKQEMEECWHVYSFDIPPNHLHKHEEKNWRCTLRNCRSQKCLQQQMLEANLHSIVCSGLCSVIVCKWTQFDSATYILCIVPFLCERPCESYFYL